MRITGILSVRNGSGLGYPYTAVIKNLSSLCDLVLVGLDPAFPRDYLEVSTLGCKNVSIVNAPWDMDNRVGGTEIAKQMDALVDHAVSVGSTWVVVMQADELLHEDDFEMLRLFMERYQDSNVTGFSLERLYFWRDLQTVRVDWNALLVRIFKPGLWSFLAEGTSKDGMFSGPTGPGERLELPYKIYHYSRVDQDCHKISKRVRNLDSFFHPENSLLSEEELPAYDFVAREYDNFSKTDTPREVEGAFEPFSGTHPNAIGGWYE